MKHTTQTRFGQPITAVLQGSEDNMVDKWDVLKALTHAADSYEIGHRTLGVLKTLLTFLPDRLISPTALSAVVFPSNKALSDRLNGMPDSTLRRHLARLVAIGIVSRHNSANHKRFARRNGQGAILAFGFDLSPLAYHFAAIKKTADTALAARETTLALRAELGRLRQNILHLPALAEAARLVLRRKPDAGAIRKMIAEITIELSDTAAHNERHIENINIIYSDSAADIDTRTQDNSPPHQASELTLDEVLNHCREYKNYFPQPICQWTELISIADRLGGMMGIDLQVFKEAMAKIGARRAATLVLCMLDRFTQIENPGGYLRRIVQNGGVSDRKLRQMLRIAS